jgi:hypothetical protein
MGVLALLIPLPKYPEAICHTNGQTDATGTPYMYDDAPGQMISLPIFISLFVGLVIAVSIMSVLIFSQLKKTP